MKLPGYYSSGEFAALAHITKKTLRYYDDHNILKPSLVSSYGARFYTDTDFARLQQILLLKSLGFSLEDIREMTINDTDYHFMADSLKLQLKLVEDRIEQLQVVAQTIRDTTQAIQEEKTVDWSKMLDLIHLMGMEKSMKNQYQNASNIAARINLHSLYSQNPQGWFPWIFQQCGITPGMRILEIGCGDGTLWTANHDQIPEDTQIILSDISEGMLRDARRSIGTGDTRFTFTSFDCHAFPYEDECFDLVIANHVLFYCEDIPKVCSEVRRVLKPGSSFICSTYGHRHMQEVNQLVTDFDDRIILSADRLYERFGKEDGADILAPFFGEITWQSYEDSLLVPDAEAMISYVLSCHGNQNQYIVDHYKDFRNFVKKKTAKGFHITKDAGVFSCRNVE
ncbi:MAG: methyltransferase domain-containing protein [Lachnospiraceae bacterium]|nr:methyltransferase domain-containing protein [Lachnospiraceae bacterium]